MSDQWVWTGRCGGCSGSEAGWGELERRWSRRPAPQLLGLWDSPRSRALLRGRLRADRSPFCACRDVSHRCRLRPGHYLVVPSARAARAARAARSTSRCARSPSAATPQCEPGSPAPPRDPLPRAWVSPAPPGSHLDPTRASAETPRGPYPQPRGGQSPPPISRL